MCYRVPFAFAERYGHYASDVNELPQRSRLFCDGFDGNQRNNVDGIHGPCLEVVVSPLVGMADPKTAPGFGSDEA